MSDNARRVAFMAHYNGGRTVGLDACAEGFGALCMLCAEIANWVRNWSKKPFCQKSCAPLLLVAGIESGDQKEMYRNFYRNFTAIFRSFPQFYRNFFRFGGPQSPPPPPEHNSPKISHSRVNNAATQIAIDSAYTAPQPATPFVVDGKGLGSVDEPH